MKKSITAAVIAIGCLGVVSVKADASEVLASVKVSHDTIVALPQVKKALDFVKADADRTLAEQKAIIVIPAPLSMKKVGDMTTWLVLPHLG